MGWGGPCLGGQEEVGQGPVPSRRSFMGKGKGSCPESGIGLVRARCVSVYLSDYVGALSDIAPRQLHESRYVSILLSAGIPSA